MTPEQLERLNLLEEKVQRITELLDAALGNFTPPCSDDDGQSYRDYFSVVSPSCIGCENFQQCEHNAYLARLSTQLLSLCKRSSQ